MGGDEDVKMDRKQLRDKLNMKIVASSYKRLPENVREIQMDQAKKYMEQLQKQMKTEIKTT